MIYVRVTRVRAERGTYLRFFIEARLNVRAAVYGERSEKTIPACRRTRVRADARDKRERLILIPLTLFFKYQISILTHNHQTPKN